MSEQSKGFYDACSREQLIEHIWSVESDCRVEITNRVSQMNEVESLRTELAAEIEKREKAELNRGEWKAEYYKEQKTKHKLQQALQKSEAEKVELRCCGNCKYYGMADPRYWEHYKFHKCCRGAHYCEEPSPKTIYDYKTFDVCLHWTKAKAIIERGAK